jgi:hypothetical protein
MATLDYQTPPPKRARWWIVSWTAYWTAASVVVFILFFFALRIRYSVRRDAPALQAAPPTTMPEVTMPDEFPPPTTQNVWY